ncbi:unnamed protein product [Urochloa decumbens]|uniref:Uncharacterized protein n=1 Tax=Urochloa decumbens TaxID=240449 RepID=A0ABC9APK2_9POAL
MRAPSPSTSAAAMRALTASAWLIVLLGSASLATATASAALPRKIDPPGKPSQHTRIRWAPSPPCMTCGPKPLFSIQYSHIFGFFVASGNDDAGVVVGVAAGNNVTGSAGTSSGGGEGAAATAGGRRRPTRFGEGCAGAEDISIYQGPASPLPGGVPAYKVDVVNRCVGGPVACAIAGIHVRCGWFSSVSLVDPTKFRRLGRDDCLVNDGRSLLGGDTVSFEYSNSFKYDLSVRAATCVRP